MQVLQKSNTSERVKSALNKASEVSEEWVGTLVSSVIDDKRIALEAKPDSVCLLLSLEKTLAQAYEQTERSEYEGY